MTAAPPTAPLRTAPAPEAAVAALQSVELAYGTVRALRGIDLEVHRGEAVGLIGPDGAGKTSTLRILAGLQRPTAGEARLFQLPIWPNRRRLQRRLGYLAQRFALYGDLTVEENIRFFALLLGVANWRLRAEALLERVGLLPFRHRLADQLSGGMKQKLALVCSLLHSPEILLLDEPTAGVDPVTRREFWRLLADLLAEGLTLLVATPYLDEAERCTRVLLLHSGRVLADAPPRRLRSLLPGSIVEISGSPRQTLRAALATLPQLQDVQPFAAGYHARTTDPTPDLEAISRALTAAGVTVHTCKPVPASLEDTFLALTATPRRAPQGDP